MRLVLITGKGGVGKTTLAAATAVTCAQRGHPILVVSTDAAHSLAEVLQCELRADPVQVDRGLHGMELDGRLELQRSWSVISGYLRQLLGVAKLDRIHADELLVVPGLDQLLALKRLAELADSGEWDAIVVDCASSADSLRLLSTPDVVAWYVERVFGAQGLVNGWFKRHMERRLAIPAPSDEVVLALMEFAHGLREVQVTLRDSMTTARLVVTPERMVIQEAQRTRAQLELYGFSVDSVLLNRLLDARTLERLPREWRVAQGEALNMIDERFSPLPVRVVGHCGGEPAGLPSLAAIGSELYGAADPLAFEPADRAMEVCSDGGAVMVRVPLAGAQRSDVSLEETRDALVVTLHNHRRSIPLPEGLRGWRVARAGLVDGRLEVVFEEPARVQ